MLYIVVWAWCAVRVVVAVRVVGLCCRKVERGKLSRLNCGIVVRATILDRDGRGVKAVSIVCGGTLISFFQKRESGVGKGNGFGLSSLASPSALRLPHASARPCNVCQSHQVTLPTNLPTLLKDDDA